MRRPDGYNEAAAYTGGNGSRQLPPGGYICRIRGAKDEVNNSYWQLVIAFDIAEGPEEGFFATQFENKKQFTTEPKWGGVYRQTVTDKDGKTNPFFKGLITCIEESNGGFVFDFDEKKLAGKLIGIIFGQEEWTPPGGYEPILITKPQQVRSVKAIREGNFKVPDVKKERSASVASTGGFRDYTPDPDEQFPF